MNNKPTMHKLVCARIAVTRAERLNLPYSEKHAALEQLASVIGNDDAIRYQIAVQSLTAMEREQEARI